MGVKAALWSLELVWKALPLTLGLSPPLPALLCHLL